MSRAFITGVTGQDGSYLAERLVAEGWDVVGTVRSGGVVGEQDVPLGVTPRELDLSDTDSIRRMIDEVQPELVVNLAAISSVAASWEDPMSTARISGLAVAALLDACWLLHASGTAVRVVQASSAEMFAGSGEVPQNELTRLAPTSPYGAAKAYGHQLVTMYRERGLHASAAILYNHESIRRPPTFVTRKITQGAARIAAGLDDRLTLGNLNVRRDWGWAPDYVDALTLIGEAASPDDYIVATGVAHSVRDFAAAAFAAAGIDDWEQFVAVDPKFARPTDAAVLRGDSSKLRQTLGWAPSHSFEEIVSEMVRYDIAELTGRE